MRDAVRQRQAELVPVGMEFYLGMGRGLFHKLDVSLDAPATAKGRTAMMTIPEVSGRRACRQQAQR
jgi:hypothetical protein